MSTLSEIMSDPIECSRKCGWEWPATPDAEHRRAVHEHAQHDAPMPVQALTGGPWQTQALEALRTVAARGKDFRVFDALEEFGLQSPPNAKSVIGRLAALMHDQGIAHPVSAAASTRPGTKGSQAGVWNRNPARCTSTELRCRAKAGAR